MKKMHSALLTLSTVTVGLWLTGPCPVRAQSAGKFEPGQLREDFQIARQSLEESHSGLSATRRRPSSIVSLMRLKSPWTIPWIFTNSIA